MTALAGAGAPATAPADYGPGARDGEQPGTPATGPAGQPGAAAAGAAWALLRDGRIVAIRRLRPQDLPAVARFHRQLSEDALYLRFFHLPHDRGEEAARRMCRPDGGGHAALGAWLGPDLVGVAQFEAVGHGAADAAFAVADRMHRLGLATLLLEHLAALARRHGIRRFTADVLARNADMLRVFEDAGLPVARQRCTSTTRAGWCSACPGRLPWRRPTAGWRRASAPR